MIGKYIDQKRQEKGITIAELARQLGLDRRTLWKSLKGTRELHCVELLTLMKIFDIKVDDLRRLDDERQTA